MNDSVNFGKAQPRLVMPPRIYATAGCEINIYYRNLTSVIDPAGFAFDVECGFGRMDQDRWHWIPTEDDVGTFPIGISMWSDRGLEDEARAELVVSSANAGRGRKSAFPCIGASCTIAQGHGEALHERFLRPGNPDVTMLGSRAPGYGKPRPGGPAVEAFSVSPRTGLRMPSDGESALFLKMLDDYEKQA